MEKYKKSKFFELLLSNDETEIKKYLFSNGKEPKVICPVQFVKKDNEDKEI